MPPVKGRRRFEPPLGKKANPKTKEDQRGKQRARTEQAHSAHGGPLPMDLTDPLPTAERNVLAAFQRCIALPGDEARGGCSQRATRISARSPPGGPDGWPAPGDARICRPRIQRPCKQRPAPWVTSH